MSSRLTAVGRALALTAAVAAIALACPADPAPGDLLLGTFEFRAAHVASDAGCAFAQVAELFPSDFTGTLSFRRLTREAFLTVEGYSHSGTFEDGWFTVRGAAPRDLECPATNPDAGVQTCTCTMDEVVSLRLLLEGEEVRECPTPLELPDGGLPGWNEPELPDAGLDVRLVCGTAQNRVEPNYPENCSCSSCAETFVLTGSRR